MKATAEGLWRRVTTHQFGPTDENPNIQLRKNGASEDIVVSWLANHPINSNGQYKIEISFTISDVLAIVQQALKGAGLTSALMSSILLSAMAQKELERARDQS